MMKKTKKKLGLPFQSLYIYVLVLLCAYWVSDIVILKTRPLMLPNQAPPKTLSTSNRQSFISLNKYRPIEKTNIFNSEGIIPPALNAQDNSNAKEEFDGPAVKTNLSIELLGTIVHLNEAKSIATISAGQESGSYRVEEEKDDLFRVTKIERKKVTFKNLNNGRLEYVEIPEENKLSISLNKPKKVAPITSSGDESNIKLSISRDDVNKYTADLLTTLKQARMVPNRVNGELQGFKFVSIRPNSIFSKLGYKPGDTIDEVNGEKITSPTQAMEAYQALKNETNIQIGGSRGGKKVNRDFTIE